MPDKKRSAEDLLARLSTDPELVRRRKQRDDEIAAREADRIQREAPILADLRAAGYQVSSVWYLASRYASYDSALPILIAHLDRPYAPDIREGIARSLAIPASASAFAKLVDHYELESDEACKFALALAVAAATTRKTVPVLLRLLRDRRNGESRVGLLVAFRRSFGTDLSDALMELQADPVLREEIGAIQKRRHRRRSK